MDAAKPYEQPIDSLAKAGTGLYHNVPFDLRINHHAIHDNKNSTFFHSAFPGTRGYFFDGLFLHVHLDVPHPPIRFFAGVPVIYLPTDTTSATSPSPIPHGFYASPRNGSIATNINYADDPNHESNWQHLFEAIRSHFEGISIPITEIINWGFFLQVVLLNSDTDRTLLPFKAGGLIFRYLYESEMGRPLTPQSQTRSTNPNEGDGPDNTQYETLRPGVRVSSDFLPESDLYRSSTLGAQVYNNKGDAFITVAAHTFPTDDAVVYHALRPGGRRIGKLAGRIGTTDIALLSLDAGQKFSNEVFLSASYEEGDESPQVRGLGRAKRYDIVTLDSPDTGVIYGSVMGFAKRCLSGGEHHVETSWVHVDYVFVGQNNDKMLPDRICGSVVRTRDQDVVTFFQYQMVGGSWDGWCTGTSSSELLDRGYS